MTRETKSNAFDLLKKYNLQFSPFTKVQKNMHAYN